MIAFNMKYPGQLLNAALSWQTNRRQSKKSRHGQKHNVTMAVGFPNATKNNTENV